METKKTLQKKNCDAYFKSKANKLSPKKDYILNRYSKGVLEL